MATPFILWPLSPSYWRISPSCGHLLLSLVIHVLLWSSSSSCGHPRPPVTIHVLLWSSSSSCGHPRPPVTILTLLWFLFSTMATFALLWPSRPRHHLQMNKYAKEWAKKLAVNEKMSNNPDSKYGENLYSVTSNTNNFKVKSDEVVDKWYGEHKEHKFGEEPKGTLLKSGHFSQMVWKDTKQMGVGKARNAAGTKVFVVANFDPQGNWMGQFADQVPPVGGFPKSATSGRTSLFSSKTKKSSTSDSDSSSDEDDFAKDCLKAHNDLRKKHGAPPLKLSKKLSKYAQEWATTIAKKDVLQHRQNNSYGENLYCAWSSNPNHKIKGHEAVDSWYEEIKDFTFGREPSDLRAGHFTQVVWEDSKELGVATARNKSGKIYVVANYSPAGNFVGSFATKVPRLK
ncbi:Golgi-associated plant pathogenesis-related protein 1-like 1 [Homarus americanus]|uniref:Golgi-associated plant pathogenesis-related protein 1-like 1 n=1 Tax=Homarus americanus TaxID=6706 RepID=A0A8J5MR76_HOMAM|nr:Golgi-associated plant pathogenesis-related protein 1-like 1 [Homarus americanus]